MMIKCSTVILFALLLLAACGSSAIRNPTTVPIVSTAKPTIDQTQFNNPTPTLSVLDKVIIDDNGVGIDKVQVSTAANRLADKGVLVVVIITDDGGGGNTTYFDQKVDELNIGKSINGTDRPGNFLIYYVSMDNPKYSGILPGPFNVLTINDTNLIRQNTLNPGLRDGDPTKALVDALNATYDILP